MKSNELNRQVQDRIYLSEKFESCIKQYKKSIMRGLVKGWFSLFYKQALAVVGLIFKKSIKTKTKLFWGDDMLLLFPEVISSFVHKYGFFEEDLSRMLLEYLRPGMVFFDVGAHFGYFTLLGSAIVGDGGQVHAFEPTPQTFKILQSNVGKRTNICLNNIALSSKDGSVMLNDYGVIFSAYNSMYTARLDRFTLSLVRAQRYRVQAMSLDKYIY